MARQKGPIPFVGRIGELSFYKDKVHGYLIRSKGGPSRQQIQKKKSMELVRQNNSEFGRASAYGALLRRAFKPLVLHCREYSMSRRLQSVLLSIIKMDESQPPGQRDVLKRHFTLLQGFELNSHLSYQKLFKKDVDVEMDKKRVVAGGRCTLSKAIAKQADCYKVVSVAAIVDFKKKRFVNDVKESELLPCKVSKEFLFEHSLNMKGTLFYGLVICFYRKNGKGFELITDDGMKAGFISFID
jgi:hypothetical protein